MSTKWRKMLEWGVVASLTKASGNGNGPEG
jgi:hypothetical protein